MENSKKKTPIMLCEGVHPSLSSVDESKQFNGLFPLLPKDQRKQVEMDRSSEEA